MQLHNILYAMLVILAGIAAVGIFLVKTGLDDYSQKLQVAYEECNSAFICTFICNKTRCCNSNLTLYDIELDDIYNYNATGAFA